MAEPKISLFLIALAWISFAAIAINGFIGALSDNYGVSSITNLEGVNQLNNITSIANQSQSGVSTFSISNLVNGFYDLTSSAWTADKATGSSVQTFYKMSDTAFANENVAALGGHFKAVVITTVLLVVFVGIFMSAVMRWPL